MASPTLNLRSDLSDYAFGVAQDEIKVLSLANMLAPVVETGAAHIQYAVFNSDNAFQSYNARRGLSGKAQRILFGADTATADLSPNALEIPIDDHERDTAGDGFGALEKAKTKSLVLNGYLAHCREVVAVAQAAIAAVANKGVWSNANTDPVDQLDEQIEALARYGMPNKLVMDIGAWRVAKNHPLVKARFNAKGFTLADFASQLLNPSIEIELTAVGINTYGFANAAQVKKAVLGAEVWIFHSSTAATPYDPSFMKTFATKASLFEGVSTYRDDSTRSDVYALDWTAKPTVVSTVMAKRLVIT
jgi:hypothetical protein